MKSTAEPLNVAVLDDYQNVALAMADWSPLAGETRITVFNDHVADPEALVARLAPFDVLCVMRERTPLPRAIIERLARLKLIVSTGRRNAAIDIVAAAERGIPVAATGYASTPTIELTWALILASARHVASENASLRVGGWQRAIGADLSGRTLGVLGLGNIGAQVARIGAAFGMSVIAWSQNLTQEKAAAAGAALSPETNFFVRRTSHHPSCAGRPHAQPRRRRRLALMKPTARLINTSRGPIVDEAALIAALRARKIAGAALDVFDREPLPPTHPFRSLDNVLATPHIGYVSENSIANFTGTRSRRFAPFSMARRFR